MNIYTVAKASQGLADYLKKNFTEPSVAIGYDSRIKSDVFAKVAAGVFSANRDAMFESKFFSANTGSISRQNRARKRQKTTFVRRNRHRRFTTVT